MSNLTTVQDIQAAIAKLPAPYQAAIYKEATFLQKHWHDIAIVAFLVGCALMYWHVIWLFLVLLFIIAVLRLFALLPAPKLPPGSAAA